MQAWFYVFPRDVFDGHALMCIGYVDHGNTFSCAAGTSMFFRTVGTWMQDDL